mgnify:CR=1 FL=1
MPIMSEDRIADRSRAIEAALLNIEKRFGKGSIMRLGERDVSDVPAISTTSLSLLYALALEAGRVVRLDAVEGLAQQRQHAPALPELISGGQLITPADTFPFGL